MIGDDTHVSGRDLPHLTNPGKTYFVTFCTRSRMELPPAARDIVLECCLHDHQQTHWLECVSVMPDHVHVITTPYEPYAPASVIGKIKSVASHRVNRLLGRDGPLWQREHFDHILRSDESHGQTVEYIANNAVRKRLVEKADEYPWFWWCGGRWEPE